MHVKPLCRKIQNTVEKKTLKTYKWIDSPHLWIKSLNIAKMSVLPESINIFSIILIKTWSRLPGKNWKADPKI